MASWMLTRRDKYNVRLVYKNKIIYLQYQSLKINTNYLYSTQIRYILKTGRINSNNLWILTGWLKWYIHIDLHSQWFLIRLHSIHKFIAKTRWSNPFKIIKNYVYIGHMIHISLSLEAEEQKLRNSNSDNNNRLCTRTHYVKVSSTLYCDSFFHSIYRTLVWYG